MLHEHTFTLEFTLLYKKLLLLSMTYFNCKTVEFTLSCKVN